MRELETLSPTDHRRHRLVIVAPTFDNARTLAGILDRIDAIRLDVIVVNDGSTDETAEFLRKWEASGTAPRRIVASHATNRGKAAALLTAFTLALQNGY